MISARSSLPSVTIVVLNWNAQHYLHNCLSALLRLNYSDFQIVVIDNNSTDDSVAFIQKEFPQVDLICSQSNRGFAAGNNIALRQANSEFVVLLNPDVIVDVDWLRHLILPMQADEKIGITGSKLFYPQRKLIQHAGGYLANPQALPGHHGLREEDIGQYETARDVEYVIGAALAIRSKAVHEIGLMDEGYFLYFEECDWCVRARRAGYRVVYVPQATAVHIESVTMTRNDVDYFQTFHTSRWRYLLKHYSLTTIIEETVAAEKVWLATLPPPHRHGLAAAYLATLKRLTAIWQARKENGLAAATPDEDEQIRQALISLRKRAWQSSFLEATLSNPKSLWGKMTVKERPFNSHIPILGKAIAHLRTLWGSVTMRPYVQALQQQQNEFNQLVTDSLRQQQARLGHQDNINTNLIQTLTRLQTEINQANNQLAAIKTRLARLNGRK